MTEIINLGQDNIDETALPPGCVVFIHDYSIGCYDGSGDTLYSFGDSWFHRDLGHCSYYGPLDGFTAPEGSGQSLDIIEKNSSQEHRDNIKPLLDAARIWEAGNRAFRALKTQELT